MYLILPLSIFVVSIVMIAVIIRRKFVYLKKLTPEMVEATMGSPESFWIELFPEAVVLIKRINLRAFGVESLNEFEKLLRKLRLISLKIDTITNKLIHRVRKETKQQEEILVKEAKIEEEKKSNGDVSDIIEELGSSHDDLKQKEQLLIIEIAKNTKDAQLYRELCIIYMRIGDWDDAKQSFEKVLEYDSSDDVTKRKLGRVLAKLKQDNKE